MISGDESGHNTGPYWLEERVHQSFAAEKGSEEETESFFVLEDGVFVEDVLFGQTVGVTKRIMVL
jgi:hypothetical protein